MKKAGRPKGTFKHLHPTRIDGKQTRAWSKYNAMLSRCHNPNSHNYAWYGGRGITVCERWRGAQGFDNFVLDMGLPPPGLTLDRKDGSLGYCKDNCKWSTWKEQANNRRQKATDPTSLRQRALAAGLPYHCVVQRIRAGWTQAEALSTPNLGPGGHR